MNHTPLRHPSPSRVSVAVAWSTRILPPQWRI